MKLIIKWTPPEAGYGQRQLLSGRATHMILNHLPRGVKMFKNMACEDVYLA